MQSIKRVKSYISSWTKALFYLTFSVVKGNDSVGMLSFGEAGEDQKPSIVA